MELEQRVVVIRNCFGAVYCESRECGDRQVGYCKCQLAHSLPQPAPV
jgi:hypothetical protein